MLEISSLKTGATGRSTYHLLIGREKRATSSSEQINVLNIQQTSNKRPKQLTQAHLAIEWIN